jgi:hypothetical protein
MSSPQRADGGDRKTKDEMTIALWICGTEEVEHVLGKGPVGQWASESRSDAMVGRAGPSNIARETAVRHLWCSSDIVNSIPGNHRRLVCILLRSDPRNAVDRREESSAERRA